MEHKGKRHHHSFADHLRDDALELEFSIIEVCVLGIPRIESHFTDQFQKGIKEFLYFVRLSLTLDVYLFEKYEIIVLQTFESTVNLRGFMMGVGQETRDLSVTLTPPPHSPQQES